MHHDARLVSVQISLVDTAAEQGALEVRPATHGGAPRGGPSLPLPLAVPAGTVAFYAPDLQHRGRGNTHTSERLFLGITLLASGGAVPSGIPYTFLPHDVGRWMLQFLRGGT